MAINLTSKLNYKIEDQEERIKLVNDILKEYEEEINNYYDNYFNPHPKCGKHGGILSTDNQMCKQLDTITNYILFSPGAERINLKNVKYNFYTEDKIQKNIKKDDHIEDITSNINNGNISEENNNNIKNDEVIDFLIRKGNNYKKEIRQIISKEDLIDPDLKIVKEYQDYINVSKKELDLLRKENKNKKETI